MLENNIFQNKARSEILIENSRISLSFLDIIRIYIDNFRYFCKNTKVKKKYSLRKVYSSINNWNVPRHFDNFQCYSHLLFHEIR